jgi:uncharacterized protein YyaL (SSP411 family)
MPNRLADSSSPYLLQHADNPVEWYPWGTEALEKSRLEDKPIFLSIGYAACHWCHVMAHESFENVETARILNEHFVNIKVDREERPDLDHIYMSAVVAMTGQGGWPMSVFLTPGQEPFYGGTYFPPTSRYNLPSFTEVLQSVAKAWNEDRERILESGNKIAGYIRQNQAAAPTKALGLHTKYLDEGFKSLSASYDWQHGGWGPAPKFPQPMAIEFMLRRASRGDEQALRIAQHALDAMSAGGMYDLIGGGFARYSTDSDWLVPHFEKMLYDNALLAKVYLHAYLITGKQRYREVCTQTLDFVIREMTNPLGGFYSSLDADSEGVEGKYYVWSEEEIRDIFSDPADADFVLSAYDFSGGSNFEGKVILRRKFNNEQLAEKFSLPIDKVPVYLENLNNKLLEIRSKRIRPSTDDKVLVAWNGLMCMAFSEASRYLNVNLYKDMATRNLNFILDNMFDGHALKRSWRDGPGPQAAFLDDYASLVLALLTHYQTDLDQKWFQGALELNEAMVSKFSSQDSLFFDTPEEQEDLIFRPRDFQDNATPAGNSLAAHALLQLAAYQGENKMRATAEKMIGSVVEMTVKHPTAFSNWLCAMDFVLNDILEVVLVAEPEDDRLNPFLDGLWSRYRPGIVAAVSPPDQVGVVPALINQRTLVGNAPTAYICQDFVCLQPVNDLDQFLAQLNSQIEA